MYKVYFCKCFGKRKLCEFCVLGNWLGVSVRSTRANQNVEYNFDANVWSKKLSVKYAKRYENVKQSTKNQNTALTTFKDSAVTYDDPKKNDIDSKATIATTVLNKRV